MWRRLLNWLLLQMDFTVWQDHAMGPGGKRNTNLSFLSSINSQNRKMQSFFLQKPLIAIELLSSFKLLEIDLTCSPNLTFTLYCSNAVPPPLHCDELHMFSCNGGPRSEGFLLIIYLLWGFLNTFMSGSLRVFSLPTEEVTLPVY